MSDHLHHGSATAGPVARTVTGFAFDIDAPRSRVFPLFGAWGERAWAGPAWQPTFLHPDPPRDEPYAVFTVRHGDAEATWLNTAFDAASGRVQYAYVLPGIQAVTIDIAVGEPTAGHTHVEVVYRRTSLWPAANAHVLAEAGRDRVGGPEWQAAIERAIAG